ncbi:MAG: ParA family protein [Lewinella sp.]|nr:ParA family protein [Lewinella sp.]
MTTVISIANNKGGVGKTSSSQNIGAALAQLGKKILLVDLDPQANLTDAFGIDEAETGIYEVMKRDIDLPLIEISKKLYLLPSGLDLSVAEIEFSSKPAREKILQRKVIDKIKDDFDFVIIDCPPSLGLLTLNALTASDMAFVPLDAEFFSMKGIDKFLYLINQVRESELNSHIDITGIFITQYEKRLILKNDILGMIEENFPGKVMQTRIRKNIAIPEAQAQGIDIFQYSKSSNGAKDYLKLTKEILKKLTHKQ